MDCVLTGIPKSLTVTVADQRTPAASAITPDFRKLKECKAVDGAPTLPAFRSPQLAPFSAAVPEDAGWLYERKYDGYRAQAVILGPQVRLITRGGHDWTDKFERLVPALGALTSGSAVLDGEICAIDEAGRSDFSRLCASLHHGGQLTFVAFDLLELDSVDLTTRPLVERKAKLQTLLGERDPKSNVQVIKFITTGGQALLEIMRAEGHEGSGERPRLRVQTALAALDRRTL
jgi:bifunctional non-homologous end joining protein LigD